MDGPRDYLTKWSKSEKKDRQISNDIAYMWNLKYDSNELIYETETDLQIQTSNLCLPKGIGDDEG